MIELCLGTPLHRLKKAVCMGLSAKRNESKAALSEGRGDHEAGRSRDCRNVLSGFIVIHFFSR